MEKKVCKCCGRELPVSEFGVMFNGAVHGICKSCMKVKQSEGHKKRSELNKQKEDDKLEAVKKARLSEFSPRDLMKELARIGYEGTLTWTETHVIDITKL